MSAAVIPQDGRSVRQFILNITINFKRGKEELDFAHKESERLHALLGSEEKSWAKARIEKLQELILGGPDADTLKTELEAKLNQLDNAK